MATTNKSLPSIRLECGSQIPYSRDLVAGLLCKAGHSPADANRFSRDIELELRTQSLSTIDESALRHIALDWPATVVIAASSASGDSPDKPSCSGGDTSGEGGDDSSNDLPGDDLVGIESTPQAFRVLAQDSLKLIGDDRQFEQLSPEQLVDVVRVYNTFANYSDGDGTLAGLDDNFADQFVTVFDQRFSDIVNRLEATLVTGMAYYSQAFDVFIGGLPHPNSLFKGAKGTKKAGSGPVKVGGTVVGLDVTYTMKDPCPGGYQVIQIVWFESIPGAQFGKKRIKHDGKDFDTFVDGGKNSPAGEITPGKPFYYSPAEAAKYIKGNKVRMVDFPNAQKITGALYFETAIVCRGGGEKGADKVVMAFKWGFTKKGKNYKTSPGLGGKAAGLEVYDDVSKEFKDTLAHDYPGYKLE